MNKIFKDTKTLTFMCVMLALTILFTFTMGMLPTSIASLAILVFVPTIITSIVYGPLLGGIMGGLTGLVTLVRALLMPTSPLDPLFINPLISVLPRIIVGILPYFAYKWTTALIKGSTFIGGLVGGFIGSAANTAFVMLMIYLIYAKEIVAQFGTSFKVFLMTVITSSGIIEAALTSIFTAFIIVVYYKRKSASPVNEIK